MKKTVITLTLALILITFICARGQKVEAPALNPNELSFWRMYKGADSLAGPNGVPYLQRLGFTVKYNLVKIHDNSTIETRIYNLETKRFWLIRFGLETFSEASFDELKQYYKRNTDEEKARIELEKAKLGSTDEKTRAERAKQIEQRLKLLSIGTFKMDTGSVKADVLTIAGHEVKPIGVKLGGDLIKTFWTTDKMPMPKGWRKFLDAMADIDPVTWKAEAALPNMALKEDFIYGGYQRGFECQSITPGLASANEFMIPSNFTKVKFPPEAK